MIRATRILGSGVDAAARSPVVRRALAALAARRRAGLVLLYHRIASPGPADHEVVPTLSLDRFRGHLDALSDVGEIVPLERILAPFETPGIRFALTFDDDESAHVEHVLPLLSERGIAATFFLGGRALHGAGPPWWKALERAIERRGLPGVAAELGIEADTPADLAARLEDDPPVEALRAMAGAIPAGVLDAGGIRSLAEAGMEIGFHTVAHRPLPLLDPDERRRAATEGRRELSRAAGVPVEAFAYPHGRADDASARVVREAGYRAAFTGSGRPVRPGVDPFLVGRWDPGGRPAEALVRGALVRLVRPTGPPAGR